MKEEDTSIVAFTKEMDISQQLNQLTSLFNQTLLTLKDDKKKIEDHLENLQDAYSEARSFGVVSEDGIIEDAINTAFKTMNEMNKRIEKVADMVVKVISTKMHVEAMIKIAEKEDSSLKGPINISKFKN